MGGGEEKGNTRELVRGSSLIIIIVSSPTCIYVCIYVYFFRVQFYQLLGIVVVLYFVALRVVWFSICQYFLSFLVSYI